MVAPQVPEYGNRTVGGSPSAPRAGGMTRQGAAAAGALRRTAQLVDRQSRDTETPLVAKRAMAETHTTSAAGANYAYTLDDAGNARIRRCTSDQVDLVVPSALDGHPVIAVDHSAFAGLAHTVSLELPNDIRDIGWNAFANCPALRRLKLPDAVAKTDKTWLAGSTQIDELVMPGSIEVIDAAFLKSCKPLHLAIGRATKTIEAPTIWTSIVEGITVDGENPFLSTDGICLYSADGSELMRAIVEQENYRIAEGCRAIGARAFEGNARIRTIELPGGLETIGESAFEDSALERIHLPASMRAICANAFRRCTNLAEAVLNEGLESIGPHAFAGCRALARLEVPASARAVGKGATAATPLSMAIHPQNRHLSIDESGLLYQRAGSGTAWALIDATDPTLAECSVRAGTVEIGAEAFAYHESIRRIELPDDLARVGRSAFEGCPELRSIDLPDSVQTLDERAFFCTPLESLRIPATCMQIGPSALAYDPVQCGTGRLTAAASEMPFAYKGLRPASDSMTAEADRALSQTPAADNAMAGVQMQIRSRLTATPMGSTRADASASPAQVRRFPLAVQVDEANQRFHVESGLLCEDCGDHARVVLYTGPDAEPAIPENATEIAPYAFASAHGVAALVLHDRIADVGAGSLGMPNPPAILRINLSEPIEGRTQVQIRLLEGYEGTRTLRAAFASGTVNVRKIIDAADRAASGTRDAFQGLRYGLERLADPFLLADTERTGFERPIARNPVAAAVRIAEHEWTRGFELMADLGFLDGSNIDAVIEQVGAKGLVAMTVQLISLKRRRFDTSNDYSL